MTRPLLFASLLTLYASVALAQSAVVSLGGRVVDMQSAAVAGAVITVRSSATGVEREVVSAADGRYAVPMLPPATYQVEVRHDGFAPWRVDALTLQVGQDRELDVMLSVGAVREAVVVQDVARIVTSGLDGVLSASRIEALPLNGRNFLELALLVPGNQPTPTFDPTKTNSVLISSAGQLGRGGNVAVDGQDNNDDVVGGPLLNLPIEAVQEFQIATNRFGAELGRSAASSINVITASGGNQLRGSAALFARNDAWQAGSPLVSDGDTTPFDRQQVSGSSGGPLVHDRAFWFGAMEYRNQDGAVLIGTRDPASRTIRRSFAPAPLDDTLWMFRVDAGSTAHRVTARYAGEQATDTAASAIERAIGSATQRQRAKNRYHSVLGSWTYAPSALTNALHVSISTFLNDTIPVATLPQLTFPSIQDGASFRMPQQTKQRRFEVADDVSLVKGAHLLRTGAALHNVNAEFDLGVFQQGRIELVEDFAPFDRNGDGRVDDNDLLFVVTLRSGKPDQSLFIPDADNVHAAGYVQDDWTVSSRLRLNLGLRYEVDTEVNNQSRVDELNPIVLPFVTGERKRDLNNWAPRIGFAWNPAGNGLVVRGGYGMYYDRVVLQIQSLERGLDGRALPIEVRAGNVFFIDPATGRLPPFAPSIANPFTGFVLPGAGASGINIIDANLQNPTIHEYHLGIEAEVAGVRLRVDGLHDSGTNFLIGRAVGEVFNPVVGGPDRVVNIESSAKTKYDALLVSAERTRARSSIRAAYTLAKAFNYANDDQIPFLNGPIDPNDLARESGPTPNDRRHRLVLSGQARLPADVNLAGIWTMSSGVPMDIMMPDGSTRIPVLQRNAGGRQFTEAADLNAFITSVNASGGINGTLLPLVGDHARFNDSFNSLDLRVSRPFALGTRARVEPLLEVFNLFNVTNILGTTNVNYSGFANVLVRDSQDPASPGYLRSSAFGQPASTAGGVFGSGGPRAMQLGARITF